MANQLNIPQLSITDDLDKVIRKQDATNKQLASKVIGDFAILNEKIDGIKIEGGGGGGTMTKEEIKSMGFIDAETDPTVRAITNEYINSLQ